MLLILKITEKSIHNQVQEYVTKPKLLHVNQSSWRANYFIDKKISLLGNVILNKAENGFSIDMIFIDIQMK